MAAVQPATLASYKAGMNCYNQFVLLSGLTNNHTQFSDISEQTLVLFVVHCHRYLHLLHSTIKLYLAGIRFLYLGSGRPNPLVDKGGNSFPRLVTILRSIKKVQPRPTLIRLPITGLILTRICSCLRAGTFGPYTDLLMETTCTTAFFGFLRCGEFTVRQHFDPDINLCFQDVKLSQDKCILTLKASKTDPFRKGIDITLFLRQHNICPVTNITEYYKVRQRCGSKPLDPLFVTSEGLPLSRAYFILRLKQVLDKLGLKSTNYSGHSFRIGACTSGADARLEDHLLQTLGRWSSDCYKRYIRTSEHTIKQAQHSLLP
jgi:hypothetical protein